MPEPLVPPIRRKCDTGEAMATRGRRQRAWHHQIEASFSPAVKKNRPRCSVLDEKIVRVEFSKGIIITDESMSR
jgi:hypothetical protein